MLLLDTFFDAAQGDGAWAGNNPHGDCCNYILTLVKTQKNLILRYNV